MADINGGAIKYTAEMDISGLKKALQDGSKGIKGFSQVVKEAGSDIDKVFDVTSENIKIQKDVIIDLEKEYKKLQSTIDNMAPGKAKLSLMGDAAKIATEIELEKKALGDLENLVQQSSVKHESLRQKLTQVKNEMIELAAAGEQNSQRYSELAEQARGYQEAIDEVNSTMSALGGNTSLTALVETMSLASSGMAVYQGVMALTAGENEKLDRIMVNLQATMSIAIGVQQLQNSLQSESAIIQAVLALQARARARAEALATSSTIASTIAQRAFNMVANANVYVLLATAIITVVGALILFSNQNKKAEEDLKALNKATADGAAEQIIAYKKLQAQWNALGNDLKAKEKFITDNKDAFKDLGYAVEDVSDAENVLVQQTTAVIAAMMLRARAAAQMELAQENYKKYLENQSEVNANEKKYQKDGWVGRINKSVNDFGSNNLGFGVSKRQNDQSLKDANLGVLKSAKELEAAAELERKAKLKLEATPPIKGSEEWYNAEIARLQILKSKAQAGSKEWNKYKAEIDRINEIINPKKPKKPAKEKQLAEVLNVGSVAKLQQELSLIDNALSNVGKNGMVALRAVDKYGKEYVTKQLVSEEEAKKMKIAKKEELAQAEARIQIKSIKDLAEESTALWEQYYSAVQSIGKEKADLIYSDLLKNNSSQFEDLQKLQSTLLQKAATTKLTPEENELLKTFNEAIDGMLGKQSALDSFQSGVSQTMSTMKSDSERLLYIQGLLKESTPDDNSTGRTAFLAETERGLIQNAKNQYQELLSEHKSFSDKKILIEKNTVDQIKKINEDQSLTSVQKTDYNKSIDKKSKETVSQMAVDELTKSKAWMSLYGGIDELTAYQMDVLLRELEAKKSTLEKVLTPVDFTILLKNLKDVKQKVNDENPFLGLFNSAQELFGAFGNGSEVAGEKAAVSFEKASEGIKGTLKAAKGIISTIEPAREYMSDTANAAIDTIEQVTTVGIVMMEAIDSTVKTVNSALKSASWSNWITAIISIIYTVIKAIVSLFTWMSKIHDKKLQKEIKNHQAAVDELKLAYDGLAEAIKSALGDDTRLLQLEQIKNLQKQNEELAKIREAEDKKKKTDKAKLAEYDKQISDNNSKMAEMQAEIIRNILQTDAHDAAAKLGDALVEAFTRGEDASKSMRDAANSMIQDIVKNALKLRLEKQIQPLLDSLLGQMGFDKNGNGSFKDLSLEQIEAFKAQMAAIGAGQQSFLDAYQKIFADVSTGAQGLKGDIKGVSEKTAGALVAQLNAMRINIIKNAQDSQSIFKTSLENLVKIEFNTRRLHNMDNTLTEMNSKMKNNLAGI